MWNLVSTAIITASIQYSGQIAAAPIVTQLPRSLLSSASRPVLAVNPPQTQHQTQDAEATKAIRVHLASLQDAGYSPTGQGVWLQANDGVLLGEHRSTQALPAASITKVATTLAALHTWDPNHKFMTNVSTNGTIVGDTLQGDLIIEGNGDPLFVWEEAVTLGNALNQIGIKRVQGDLIVAGRFYMNFESDRQKATQLLAIGLDSQNWTNEALYQWRQMPPGTAAPQVEILGNLRPVNTLTAADRLSSVQLVQHESLPLWQLLKRMNIYSNNAMAEMLAAAVGGPGAVSQKASQATGVPRSEIRLINGSGLGQQNQISARAAVAMMIAVHNRAIESGLTIADLFPMSDCNCGTIKDRNLPTGAIVKTGTLSDVSALAGVIQTRDRGPVWFAILNRGNGDVRFFHQIQDQVLQTLTQVWGNPPAIATRNFSPFQPIPWQDGNRDRILISY
ncbi:peptidase S13 D-Ala-D-Ala carboxypeptidase C [Thalassoporum mexicanum PCC 7367]|uniref:D-alanyl-D-alanine carboxypeptidase n=1 Tax=Thalassoporum mexicanum TaxID=3457544 RepID=UPI00029FB189|nr:D-alanyl-D-alanine carboxypeptidase [Pseudanabaena sp. PCC 7367]AFY70259.1 peptidase S13 D-Ala-D-Ala carboxypeptidase C [Pseudanabaena sp. PCC 7367]